MTGFSTRSGTAQPVNGTTSQRDSRVNPGTTISSFPL